MKFQQGILWIVFCCWASLAFAGEVMFHASWNKDLKEGQPYQNTVLEMKYISKALQSYFEDHGVFPAKLESLHPGYYPKTIEDLLHDDFGNKYHYQLLQGCPDACTPLSLTDSNFYDPTIPQFAGFVSMGKDFKLDTEDDIDFTTPSTLIMEKKLDLTKRHLNMVRTLVQTHINDKRDGLLSQIITQQSIKSAISLMGRYYGSDGWGRLFAFDSNQGKFYSLGPKGVKGLDKKFYVYDDTALTLPPPTGFGVSLVKRCPSRYKPSTNWGRKKGEIHRGQRVDDCEHISEWKWKPYLPIDTLKFDWNKVSGATNYLLDGSGHGFGNAGNVSSYTYRKPYYCGKSYTIPLKAQTHWTTSEVVSASQTLPVPQVQNIVVNKSEVTLLNWDSLTCAPRINRYYTVETWRDGNRLYKDFYPYWKFEGRKKGVFYYISDYKWGRILECGKTVTFKVRALTDFRNVSSAPVAIDVTPALGIQNFTASMFWWDRRTITLKWSNLLRSSGSFCTEPKNITFYLKINDGSWKSIKCLTKECSYKFTGSYSTTYNFSLYATAHSGQSNTVTASATTWSPPVSSSNSGGGGYEGDGRPSGGGSSSSGDQKGHHGYDGGGQYGERPGG